MLADEVEAARAEDLGKIDTFRFEETRSCGRRWPPWATRPATRPPRGRTWASARDDGCVVLAPRRPRAPVRLAARPDAARLGLAIEPGRRTTGADPAADDPLERPSPPTPSAVPPSTRPTDIWSSARAALLYPPLPEFETLRARLDGVRSLWRTWADGWARDFNALCTARGFLPGAALQQRTIFDEVVKPLAQEPGTTAYFVVDALRFEMGEELFGSSPPPPRPRRCCGPGSPSCRP